MKHALSASSILACLCSAAVWGFGCAGDTPAGPEAQPDAAIPADSGPGSGGDPGPGSGSGTGSGTGTPPKVCTATEHLEDGKCLPNVRPCTIANGVGEQKFANGKFGKCTLKSCNAGYQRTAAVCTPTFVGKFKTSCFLEQANGLDVRYTNDYSDDVNHILIGEVYESNNGACGGALYRIVRQIGTYKRIKPSTTAPGAVALDFEHPMIEITLRSPGAVSSHNRDTVCGKSDWVIDTPYRFARAACTSNPLLVRTINKVDGDLLYVGNFDGPKDPDGRPQTLNLTPANVGHRIP